MKIWIKLLIGAILGSVIGLILPASTPGMDALFPGLYSFAIGFARYALLPLLFFSIPVAVYELYEERTILKTSLLSILYSFAAVCVTTLLGTAAAVLLKPTRIPLVAEAARISQTPTASDFLLGLLPANGFAAIFGSGDFILPLIIACFALGLGFCVDKTVTKPVLTIFDSLSRVLWQINGFFVEILAVIMIPLSVVIMYRQRSAFSSPIYHSLLLTIGIETFIAAFLILPLILYLAGGRKNPFPRLYAMLGPALAGLVGGDSLFPAGALLKHHKDSLGLRRRIGTVSIPLALVFGRAGTALITSTAFIVVLGSYSNIGLSFSNVLWVLIAIPPVMVLMGASPGAGPATAVMTLCALFGRGFESGYLLIVPVAAPLIACAVLLDILFVGTVSYLVGIRAGGITEREIRHFI